MKRQLLAFLTLPLAGLAVGALVGLPQLVHMFDEHQRAEVSVEQIAAGTIPSRNVSVSALLRGADGVREDMTPGEDSQASPTRDFYLPIITPGSDPAAPYVVIVKTHGLEIFEAFEHPETPVMLEGRVRNVAWEGVGREVRTLLASAHPIADQLVLLEMTPGSDAPAGYGFPLLGLIIGLFAAAQVGKKPDGE